MDVRWMQLAAALLLAVSMSDDAWAQSRSRYNWEAEDSQYGFAVYSSTVPDHDYDVTKVVAVLDVPVLTLVHALQDFANYPRWYYQCIGAQVLERPKASQHLHVSDNGQIDALSDPQSFTLFILHRPGALDDRWAIIRTEARLSTKHELVIEFQSLDNYAYHAPAESVRMRIRGAWTLFPIGPHRTRVSFILDSDPNTSTPTFLVDPKLAEIAIETMRGLQRITRPASARQTSTER
jgi:hypothetical protein